MKILPNKCPSLHLSMLLINRKPPLHSGIIVWNFPKVFFGKWRQMKPGNLHTSKYKALDLNTGKKMWNSFCQILVFPSLKSTKNHKLDSIQNSRMLLILHPSFEGILLSKKAQDIEPAGDQEYVQDWLDQQLGHLFLRGNSKFLPCSLRILSFIHTVFQN